MAKDVLTPEQRIEMLEKKVALLEKTIHLVFVGVDPMLGYMDRSMEEIDGKPRPSDGTRPKARAKNGTKRPLSSRFDREPELPGSEEGNRST